MSDIRQLTTHTVARFSKLEQDEAERERRLREWYLAVLSEDRAETAMPPPELLEEGGHG